MPPGADPFICLLRYAVCSVQSGSYRWEAHREAVWPEITER